MNIVLAYGFFGFRTFFEVEYFNGVKEDLEAKFHELPINIFVSQVDPIGRVERRARTLARQIATALNDGTLDSGEPVHIIAHSMGGLDARCCISSGFDDVVEHIASLTTIGTPHLGSPVADLLTADNQLDRIKRSILFSAGPLSALVGDVDLRTGGIQDLTSDAAKIFNQQYKDVARVRYFSYAGNGRDGALPTCAVLLATHALISERVAEENDGLVSVSSAAWGQPLGIWPGDHADEIGHNLDHGLSAPSWAFNVLGKYASIVIMLKSLALPR